MSVDTLVTFQISLEIKPKDLSGLSSRTPENKFQITVNITAVQTVYRVTGYRVNPDLGQICDEYLSRFPRKWRTPHVPESHIWHRQFSSSLAPQGDLVGTHLVKGLSNLLPMSILPTFIAYYSREWEYGTKPRVSRDY